MPTSEQCGQGIPEPLLESQARTGTASPVNRSEAAEAGRSKAEDKTKASQTDPVCGLSGIAATNACSIPSNSARRISVPPYPVERNCMAENIRWIANCLKLRMNRH